MNDLISRQAAIDALDEEPEVWHDDNEFELGARSQWRHDMEAIMAVPSAQPEIIRCKDCKYCRKVDESEYWCYGFCSPPRLVRKDDFCSYGCKNK